MKRQTITWRATVTLGAALAALGIAACAARRAVDTTYHDETMDFSLVRTVAVLPFSNLTPQQTAAERVRDVFITALQAEGTVYVLPPGEITKGLSKATIANPAAPSSEEAIAFAKAVGADAIVTGSLLEYGETRSGSASANFITISAKMIESQTGKVVWSSVATKGGVGAGDRLFGGGGKPMNDVTLDAVRELISRLMK